MIIDCLASSDLGRMIPTLLAVQALLVIQAVGSQQLPRQIAPSTAAIQGIVRNPRGFFPSACSTLDLTPRVAATA